MCGNPYPLRDLDAFESGGLPINFESVVDYNGFQDW